MDFTEGSSEWMYHSCLESADVCEMLADDVKATEDLVKKLEVQLADAKKYLDKLKTQQKSTESEYTKQVIEYKKQLAIEENNKNKKHN